MSTEARSPCLAVLIDADNVSFKIADGLFEEIAKFGEASVRRIYGDFSDERSKGWAKILPKHAIIPQHQSPHTTGKNASDIAMVIDAMDLLHSGRFDGFCLVSSDSDFTRLAARIREQGVDVFGFGEQKTPESFRKACRRFIYTEGLLSVAPPNKKDTSSPTKSHQPLSAAILIISEAIKQLKNGEDWVPLSSVGKQLANSSPGFGPRSYGCINFSDLVRKTNAFEIELPEGGSMRVRYKPSAAKPAKGKPGQVS
ncbi:MAG: NYN domain-containing protein [Rhodospirillales bacterium]|nr:NYN domain-containing protein [Rhodospirillales bacterium]